MECLPSTSNHQGPVKYVSPTYSTSTPIIVEDITSEYTTPTYIYDNAEELFHTDMTYCKPLPEPPPKTRTFDHVNVMFRVASIFVCVLRGLEGSTAASVIDNRFRPAPYARSAGVLQECTNLNT